MGGATTATLPALQRAAGNQAVARLVAVQRDDKGSPDVLTSPRFSDNQRLQQAYQEKPPLTPADKVEPVRLVQEALVEVGYDMPRSNKKGTMDGVWGNETKATLRRYQARRGLTINGTSAGRETLGALDRDPGIAPTSGDLTFNQFRRIMEKRWGVPVVRIGTYESQKANVLQGHDPPPPFVPKKSWVGPALTDRAPLYRAVLDAFEKTALAFGGIGTVRRIEFFGVEYVVVDGVVGPNPQAGAAYDHTTGELFIYTSVVQTSSPMLLERTKPPGAGGSGKPAQEKPTGTAAAVRNVTHELGHAFEHRMTHQSGGSGLADSGLINDFCKKVGWFGPPFSLYDIQAAGVAAAMQSGGTKTPDPAHKITKADWDADKWGEQPMTRYSLEGPSEDFAESLQAYVRAPAALKDRSPARFQFLQERKETWNKHPTALHKPKALRPTVDLAPATGTVTASVLRVRTGPGVTFAAVGTHAKGETVELLREVEGQAVQGNTAWHATGRGYVSGAYVKPDGPVPKL